MDLNGNLSKRFVLFKLITYLRTMKINTTNLTYLNDIDAYYLAVSLNTIIEINDNYTWQYIENEKYILFFVCDSIPDVRFHLIIDKFSNFLFNVIDIDTNESVNIDVDLLNKLNEAVINYFDGLTIKEIPDYNLILNQIKTKFDNITNSEDFNEIISLIYDLKSEYIYKNETEKILFER